MFNAARRVFLKAIGLAPLGAVRRSKPDIPDQQTAYLVRVALEKSAPLVAKMGKPDEVFVHCGYYGQIHFAWAPVGQTVVPGWMISPNSCVIDLGHLHPDENRHLRWMLRVGDQLSEHFGCDMRFLV